MPAALSAPRLRASRTLPCCERGCGHDSLRIRDGRTGRLRGGARMTLMIKRGRRYVPAARCDVIAAATQLQVREIDGTACAAPEVTRGFLSRLIGHSEVEQFMCIWLDNRHRVITSDVMFTGTIDRASVHPREVVKRALERNAAAVILAHNHPSGQLSPSSADELITRRLKEALAMLDIRMLDHFIITGGSAFSFTEHGLL